MSKRKVPQNDRLIMVGVAIVLDIINIVSEPETLFLGGVIMDMVSTAVFHIWLSRYGISLWSSANIDRSLVTVFLDFIPFGDLTFPWARRVWNITKQKKEDTIETDFNTSRPVSSWRL